MDHIPSNLKYKTHQIPKIKCFSSRPAVVFCAIYWSHVLSWAWRCSWSIANRRCPNYIWVINNFIAYQGASNIKDFMVCIVELCDWKHWCLDKMANIFQTCSNAEISFRENIYNLIQISQKFLPEGSKCHKEFVQVQVIAWRWTGDKPLTHWPLGETVIILKS